MQLTVGERECFVGVEILAGLTRLAVQGGCYTLASAGQPQIALVGEHDGLGSAASADDHRFGVGSVLAEALQQRRELSACLARREDVVRLAGHTLTVA